MAPTGSAASSSSWPARTASPSWQPCWPPGGSSSTHADAPTRSSPWTSRSSAPPRTSTSPAAPGTASGTGATPNPPLTRNAISSSRHCRPPPPPSPTPTARNASWRARGPTTRSAPPAPLAVSLQPGSSWMSCASRRRGRPGTRSHRRRSRSGRDSCGASRTPEPRSRSCCSSSVRSACVSSRSGTATSRPESWRPRSTPTIPRTTHQSACSSGPRRTGARSTTSTASCRPTRRSATAQSRWPRASQTVSR